MIYILEATAIAAANTCIKLSTELMFYLQQLKALPRDLSLPWGLNRTHALLDYYGSPEAGESQLSISERADIAVQSISKRGGYDGQIQDRIKAGDNERGGIAAAKSKSATAFAQMIQNGRIATRKSNFNLGGAKITWGSDVKDKINVTEKDLRLWIDFTADNKAKHPKCWIKDNSRPELQTFALKAEGIRLGEIAWVESQLSDKAKIVEIAERIVALAWRRQLIGKEVQEEKRRR
jgi:hypothetical protein